MKCQSNLEIARTPRNAFRCSLGSSLCEVERLIGCEGFTAYQVRTNSECAEVERLIGCEGFTAYQVRTNSECAQVNPGSEGMGAKVRAREEKNPDRRLRPRNAG